jgi:hypothetical protein
MTRDDARVRLPPDLQAQCEKRIEGTNFESVEEYVTFVMAAVLDSDDPAAGSPSRTGDANDSPPRDDEVTDRLESLGYL